MYQCSYLMQYILLIKVSGQEIHSVILCNDSLISYILFIFHYFIFFYISL